LITGGYRATDNFAVFPKIERQNDGSFCCRFFLHGWRHVSESAQRRLQDLKPNEKLSVAIEITNPASRLAIQIQTSDYHMIGWSPRYLVSDLVAAVGQSAWGLRSKSSKGESHSCSVQTTLVG
jgi:hypothetical protein